MVCAMHELPICGICCVDFSFMERECEPAPRSGRNKNKKWLGNLAKGTRVMLKDRSGRQPPTDLYGTLIDTRIAECDTGDMLPHYVIRYDDVDIDKVPVEDVEDEWSVVS